MEDQLHHIHYQRNKNVWIFHALLALGSTYFQREKLFEQNYWWIALAVIFTGLAIRFLIFNIFYEAWKKGIKWASTLNYFALIILTSGWMIHFWSIYHAYGVLNHRTGYGLIFIAGLVTGATVSLAAHPASFFLFTSIMCGVPVIIFLCDNKSDLSILFPIVAFYFFNLYNFRLGNRQLRRSVENEIQASQEKDRIARIINTVPGFVGVVDKAGVIQVANQATLSLFPGIIGKKIGSINNNAGWEKEVLSLLHSDRQSSITEQHSIVNGKDIWALLNIHKTDEGGVIIVSIQINELMEARKKLREQEAKTQYTAKLASLGEMAASIAHEVNNPLTIIQGAASVMQKLVETEPLDVASVKMLTGKLINTTDRISRTIKSLKNLSRSGDNDPFGEINLENLIQQCFEISKVRLDKNEITFKYPQCTEPVYFRGREVQLSQVLLNLLSNAIDAVKNETEKWIEIDFKDGPQYIDIMVKDSGPGVPVEIRHKIMEPFFTTKEVNQGTGLGLSISKSILMSHGGELTLEEGRPTTFKMRIPKNLPGRG